MHLSTVFAECEVHQLERILLFHMRGLVFMGQRVPLKIWPSKYQPLAVFVERLHQTREHCRIGVAHPTIEPDSHIGSPRSKTSRSPRRSAGLEIETSEEIPCNLCRVIRIPK